MGFLQLRRIAIEMTVEGEMMTARLKETAANVSKHPDSMMTPAQIARRKFKSSLPRKAQNRTVSPMQALGETFTLLDQFRDMVHAEKQKMDAAKTVYAALAYTLPDAAKLAFTLTVPEPGKIGPFCETVLELERKSAAFLGVVFVQVDPDAEKAAYKAVSFVVPFVSGPDAEARLLFAQKEELTKIQKKAEGLRN
jgi:hypothetical protein